MTTLHESERFKADFGYEPCFKTWPDARATDHHCRKPAGHTDDCVCSCGERCTPAMWKAMGVTFPSHPEDAP